MEDKLIKSFIVIKRFHNLEIGEIIQLRKHQAMVPLEQDELYFECLKNEHNFSFKFLKSNLGKNTEIHECFSSLKEKFDHIS